MNVCYQLTIVTEIQAASTIMVLTFAIVAEDIMEMALFVKVNENDIFLI